jgi:hypothetical protein
MTRPFQQYMDLSLNACFVTGYRRRTRLGIHQRWRMTNIRNKAYLLSHLALRHLFHACPRQHLLLLVQDLPDFRMAPVVARCHGCQHLTCLRLMPSGEEVRYTLCRMSMGVIKINLQYLYVSSFPGFVFCFFFFCFLRFSWFQSVRVTLGVVCALWL